MIHRMAIIGVAALLIGCDDSDPVGSGANKTYSATVAGDMAATIQGPAHFGSGEFEGDIGFAVLLGDEDSEHTMVLGKAGASRPAKGDYAFQAPDAGELPAGKWTGVYILADDEEMLGMFWTTSGTMRVTESSERRFKGTFEFTAVGFLAENMEEEVELTITGSFDAGAATMPAELGISHLLMPR